MPPPCEPDGAKKRKLDATSFTPRDSVRSISEYFSMRPDTMPVSSFRTKASTKAVIQLDADEDEDEFTKAHTTPKNDEGHKMQANHLNDPHKRTSIADTIQEVLTGRNERLQHRRVERSQAALIERQSTASFSHSQLVFGGQIPEQEHHNESSDNLQVSAEGRRLSTQHLMEITQLSDRYTEKEKEARNLISQLQTQNDALTEKAARLQQQLDAACADFARELDELQSANSYEPTKVTDTEMQRSWKDLAFLVRQFVQNHCPESFSATAIQQLFDLGDLPDLTGLCSNPEIILQSPFLCPSLLESFVWWLLFKYVFSPEAEYWGGESGRLLTCAYLSILSKYHLHSLSTAHKAFLVADIRTQGT